MKNLILTLVSLLGSGHQLHAQQWQPLGPDGANWPCEESFGRDGFVVDPSGAPLIAFRGSSLDYRLTVRRWSGSSWFTVGDAGFTNALSDPCLATDDLGNPFVAYMDQENGGRISVRQWIGGGWEFVGVPGFTIAGAVPSGLEVDAQGRPVVLFVDNTQGERLSVWHWTGMIWEPIGQQGFSLGRVGDLDLALDGSGDPVVAYRDDANGKRTTVQRWNGNAWEYVGSAGFSPDSAMYQSIALDAADNPVVAYQEKGFTYRDHTTVQRWNGAAWEFVGDRGFSNNFTRCQAIAVGSSGDPIVAYLDQVSDGGHVKVQKWNGSVWQQCGIEEGPLGLFSLGLGLEPSGEPIIGYTNLYYGGRETVQKWDGVSWIALGELGFSVEEEVVGANKVSLALDTSDAPVVVYSDAAYSNRLSMQRWNGSSWERVGPAGFVQGGSSSSFKISSTGVPVVAYQDGIYGKASVSSWNGSSWQLVGPSQFSDMQAYYLDLALDPEGGPTVAYQDRANGYKTTVRRWNGSEWEVLGQQGFSYEAAWNQRVAVDTLGTPYVAHRSGASDRASVHRWNGSSWQGLSTYGFATRLGSDISMILDRSGNPILAYVSSVGVTVQRWNGSAWDLLGSQGIASDDARYLSLTLDTAGLPLLAYKDAEASGGGTVQRWNGSSWEMLGSPGFTSLLTAESKGWIQVDGSGRVIVAFSSGGAYAMTYPGDTTGLSEIDSLESDLNILSIGPNPNSGQELQVRLAGLPSGLSTVHLELCDPSGRNVGALVLPAQQGEVNAKFMLPPGLPSGLYIVSVLAGDARWMAKLVISKQ